MSKLDPIAALRSLVFSLCVLTPGLALPSATDKSPNPATPSQNQVGKMYFAKLTSNCDMLAAVIVTPSGYLDPYDLAHKKGVSYLQKKFVANREFSIYDSGVAVGTVKNLTLGTFGLKPMDGIVKAVEGKGECQSFPGIPPLDTKNRLLLVGPAGDKPLSSHPPPALAMGEAEKKQVIANMRRMLEPGLLAQVEKKTSAVIEPWGVSKYVELYGTDIEGNGQADVIGKYQFLFRGTGAHLVESSIYPDETILFIVRDNGKTELIATAPDLTTKRTTRPLAVTTGISATGFHDFDGDGIAEIIAEADMPVSILEGSSVRMIDIYTYRNSRWTRSFQTRPSYETVQ